MSAYQLERSLGRLEKLYDGTDDESERAALREEMREIERELADAERWEQEGRDRGFL